MSNYRIFLGDHYETGCGVTVSIFIINSTCEQEFIDQQIKQVFGEYYADSVQEVDEKILETYKTYIPSYVIGIVRGHAKPGAFRWHSQFMINYG